MTNVICVLKTGGTYTVEWVRKLRDAVARNTTKKHTFVCLSDVETPCNRISLKHNWAGWWSKIELFDRFIFNGPALYLDLDTVIVGNIDHLLDLDYDFAMLENFNQPGYVGSGVMWFRNETTVPHKVYEKFLKQPQAYMAHHERVRKGSHVGDQAFIADTIGLDNIPRLKGMGLKSFKRQCLTYLPPDARVVCFHGPPRLGEVKNDWIDKNWV